MLGFTQENNIQNLVSNSPICSPSYWDLYLEEVVTVDLVKGGKLNDPKSNQLCSG